ncbi:helicase associated domain-containing protein [Streptomyces sp. NPDC048350]|uniref:helicase associated domain-containing protein n=1 Tax=Streptomyces sp. NPDC048350 TaxID=3365538 RepID=UPI00371874B0
MPHPGGRRGGSRALQGRAVSCVSHERPTSGPRPGTLQKCSSGALAHGDLRVPFTYRIPEGEKAEGVVWPSSLANFPLGQRTADARRFYARGDMDEERVAQLEELGMAWSHFDVTWADLNAFKLCGRVRRARASPPVAHAARGIR